MRARVHGSCVIPEPLTPATLLVPAPVPVPVLAMRLVQTAGRSANYLSGVAKGRYVRYADLHAYSWYQASPRGWQLRNRHAGNGLTDDVTDRW